MKWYKHKQTNIYHCFADDKHGTVSLCNNFKLIGQDFDEDDDIYDVSKNCSTCNILFKVSLLKNSLEDLTSEIEVAKLLFAKNTKIKQEPVIGHDDNLWVVKSGVGYVCRYVLSKNYISTEMTTDSVFAERFNKTIANIVVQRLLQRGVKANIVQLHISAHKHNLIFTDSEEYKIWKFINANFVMGVDNKIFQRNFFDKLYEVLSDDE